MDSFVPQVLYHNMGKMPVLPMSGIHVGRNTNSKESSARGIYLADSIEMAVRRSKHEGPFVAEIHGLTLETIDPLLDYMLHDTMMKDLDGLREHMGIEFEIGDNLLRMHENAFERVEKYLDSDPRELRHTRFSPITLAIFQGHLVAVPWAPMSVSMSSVTPGQLIGGKVVALDGKPVLLYSKQFLAKKKIQRHNIRAIWWPGGTERVHSLSDGRKIGRTTVA